MTEEFDFGQPTGYVFNAEATENTKAACLATAPSDFMGAAKRLIASGVHYFNLRAFQADYLRADYDQNMKAFRSYQHSLRKVIDLGADGIVLAPLGQTTGTCNGESAGEALTVALAANYVATGTGPKPAEFTAIGPYLAGRELSITGKGDSGSCPAYSTQFYHDFGGMPVTAGGFDKLPPNGPGSQESQMVARRDKPSIPQEWVDACGPYKIRTFSPSDQWEVADAIATFRPVQKGAPYQIRETAPGGNGISALYKFPRNGAHATFFEGFGTLQGRLIGITMESWWNVTYPGSQWPDHRVVIQTDDGPQKLYPGQGAFWMDQFVPTCTDLWAYDYPGSRA